MIDKSDCSNDNVFNLFFTGDIMLGGTFLDVKEKKELKWDYPFKEITPFIADSDIVVANLECSLSKNGSKRVDKSSILYSPPESLNALRSLNCNVLCLSNNHISDYGEKGLIETLDILSKNNFFYFGAGINTKKANKELMIQKNGYNISFLGYTTNESYVNSIIADENKAGCVHYDKSVILDAINKIKSKSDIICISLHWGYEFYDYPSPDQIKLAHEIIDAGAHIVVGHHPHVIQGFEKYNDGFIFYSLGNFFFSDFYRKNGIIHKWNNINKYSIVPKCSINNGKIVNVDFYYSFMDENYKTIFLKDPLNNEIRSKFESISDEIKKENYADFWKTYSKEKKEELNKVSNMTNLMILFKTIQKMGIKNCMKKLSLKNTRNSGKIILAYAYSIFR